MKRRLCWLPDGVWICWLETFDDVQGGRAQAAPGFDASCLRFAVLHEVQSPCGTWRTLLSDLLASQNLTGLIPVIQ